MLFVTHTDPSAGICLATLSITIIQPGFVIIGMCNLGSGSLCQLNVDLGSFNNILIRILLKEPRSTLSWHRDPEPRLHIPIITNPGCIMVIDNVAKHMPADGSVWVTNNTKYHNAFNGGEENRIHLVACVLDYNFN